MFGKLPRWIWRVLTVLLLAGVAAFVLAWRHWDHPALDHRVRELAAWRDVQIEGEPFGYSPLRGLRLRGTQARIPLPNGAAVLKVPRGSVRLDLFRLREEVRCQSILAEGAEINFLLGPARKKTKRPDSPERDSLDLDPRYSQFAPEQVKFEGSSLGLHEVGKQQPLLVLEEFDFTLENLTLSPFPDNLFEALIGSGEIRAGKVRAGSAEYSDLRGRFELIDGKLRFDELRFNAPSGEFRFSQEKALEVRRAPVAEIDLGSGTPTLTGSLSAHLDDCRRLAPDLLSGLSEPVKGQLACKLGGALTPPQGDCSLVLRVEGDAGKIPFIHRIVRLVLPKQRRVAAKGQWSLAFKVHDSAYELQDVSLETDGPSFLLKGRISERSLALEVDVLIPKSKIRTGTFPPSVLSELSVGPDRIRFPFVVSGTTIAPQVELRRNDLSALAFSELRAFLRFQSVVEGLSGGLLP